MVIGDPGVAFRVARRPVVPERVQGHVFATILLLVAMVHPVKDLAWNLSVALETHHARIVRNFSMARPILKSST